MTQQTKLVHCGSTTFVYDFNSRNIIKNLGFEKDNFKGSITHLRRLLLTNFIDERILVTFSLTVSLSDYNEITKKLFNFIHEIKELSGKNQIKYLALLELPLEEDNTYGQIKLVTDIEILELTIALEEVLGEELEYGYFKLKCGDDVSYDVYSPKELLNAFSLAYRNSLTCNHFKGYPKLFKSQLQEPLILWNAEADTFIKEQNLINCPKYNSDEIYDNIAGFVIINEYSLY
ncbi:hypothetical protein [Metabacillus elymi]|uniref:Uncharacterized protein n=1 Tax=Metabacillus elymi TaxID=2745198 RepID=A0ABX6S3W3_9BACI|nr:hypothetical protein [Metabacillus sp. KUDC1714]QNF28522.1 hypothetical protein HUW50_14165 [Metabacillus sp. KUDC1714]